MPEILTLPWLVEAPTDFAERCQRLPGIKTGPGTEAQALATFRLSASQSAKLTRRLRKMQAQQTDLSPLLQFRLGVLASNTFDLLLDLIPAAAARHGIALEIETSAYDQVVQEALDPGSIINRSRCDAVLVAVDHRWFGLERLRVENPAAHVAAAVQQLRCIIDALRASGGAPTILQTVPVPPLQLFGSFDRRLPGTIRFMLDETNRAIGDLAADTGSYLLDVAAMAERIGTDLWFSPVHWHAYKLPFSPECFPAYADLLGRLLGAIRGRTRKCLILDLDNTLWGGAIGDDGCEGIQLGPGGAAGEAYLAVQQCALELRERGIILAVCSKNTDEVARRPFREHPEMVLREKHFAAFNANWLDKPANIDAIARKLNLGLDAMVVLDDNPAERAQIRAALPMVAVPELPRDASWYPWYLTAAGYFEAVAYSAEDGKRAESYVADAERTEVLSKTRDLGDYLSALEMVLRFAPFDASNRPRIVQLVNKTNQFNLTTRRYTEHEIREIERDPQMYTLQVRLEDKFGDLGMIGVIICSKREADWHIDTWLMSCRVLGRRVEEAMLAALINHARNCGVIGLIGTYVPTSKNTMVSSHYSKLGFEEIGCGTNRFRLDLARYVEPCLPFKSEHAVYAETPTRRVS